MLSVGPVDKFKVKWICLLFAWCACTLHTKLLSTLQWAWTLHRMMTCVHISIQFWWSYVCQGWLADLHSWLASPKDILDDFPLCEWVAAQVIEQTHTIATADCNNPTHGHHDQVWGCYIAKENLHMLPGSCCLLVQHMNGWPFIWNVYLLCSLNVRSNKTHHMISCNSFDLFSEDPSAMYIFASSWLCHACDAGRRVWQCFVRQSLIPTLSLFLLIVSVMKRQLVKLDYCWLVTCKCDWWCHCLVHIQQGDVLSPGISCTTSARPFGHKVASCLWLWTFTALPCRTYGQCLLEIVIGITGLYNGSGNLNWMRLCNWHQPTSIASCHLLK